VVTLALNRIVAYDAESGAERWWVPGSTPQPIGAPVVGGGLLFANAAFAGSAEQPLDSPDWEDLVSRYDADHDSKLALSEAPAEAVVVLRPELPLDAPGATMLLRRWIQLSDFDRDGAATAEEWKGTQAFLEASRDKLVAIQPEDEVPDASPRIAWSADRGLSEMPSPLFYRDRLYLVRDGGMITSYEAATGRVVLDRRRLGVRGRYAASPVAAAGRLYVASESGSVIVLRAADELEVLAKNDLGEGILATPAIADDTLYVRTTGHLWAFGEPIDTVGRPRTPAVRAAR